MYQDKKITLIHPTSKLVRYLNHPYGLYSINTYQDGHIIWFTILYYYSTCAAYFTLLIRDFVMHSFDWERK